jgi:hypothetical protein
MDNTTPQHIRYVECRGAAPSEDGVPSGWYSITRRNISAASYPWLRLGLFCSLSCLAERVGAVMDRSGGDSEDEGQALKFVRPGPRLSARSRLGGVRGVKKIALEKQASYESRAEERRAAGRTQEAEQFQALALAWQVAAWHLQQHEGNLARATLRREQAASSAVARDEREGPACS